MELWRWSLLCLHSAASWKKKKRQRKFVYQLSPVYHLQFTHLVLDQVLSPVLLRAEGWVPTNVILFTDRHRHNTQARRQRDCPGFWKEPTIAQMSLSREESGGPKPSSSSLDFLCDHCIPNYLLWMAGVKMFYIFSIPVLLVLLWLPGMRAVMRGSKKHLDESPVAEAEDQEPQIWMSCMSKWHKSPWRFCQVSLCPLLNNRGSRDQTAGRPLIG